MNDCRTFFITGVSSGFGRALAHEALLAGHRVVGTVRNADALREFESQQPERAHGRLLELTNFEAVRGIVDEVESSAGPVDVLVNNAGYGHEGVLEESSIEELQHQFSVNVFAPVALIKAFLPYFRRRRRGHLINITSMGGFITMPGIAYYCGSKFALEGISEVLAKELRPFNIAVTAVAPGSFRTNWAGRSMTRAPRSIADYDELFDPIREARMRKSGHQLGNPTLAARAILSLVGSEAPPEHLLLGSDALGLVREKLVELSRQIDLWEPVTRSTDD